MSKKKTILKSTIIVAFITLIIKVMGLVRQMVIASYCGASLDSDTFFLASGMMLSLATIVISSITLVLQKAYVNRVVTENRKRANNLLSASLKVFLPIAIIVCLLFVFLSPFISRLLAPSFDDNQLGVLTKHIRLLSFVFVFSTYYLIVDVALLAEKRFIPGKIQILLQNVLITLAAVFLYDRFGIDCFIYSVLISMAIQCVYITIAARKIFLPSFKAERERKELLHISMLALPVLLGNAMFEINDFIDKRIANGLGEGNVSYLTYGSSINEMVTTLIIASLATVMFTNFNIWFSEGKTERVQSSFKKAFLYLFAIMVPIMVFCFVCSDDVVEVLFGRGRFESKDIIQTSYVVIGYSLGFFFQASRSILSRTYYSFGNTKTPMITGALIVITNVGLSAILSRYVGAFGIAIATSASMLVGTITLLPGIKKMLPAYKLFDSFYEYFKILVSGMLVLVVIFFAKYYTSFGAVENILIFGFSSLITFALFLWILRSKCIKELLSAVKNKLSQKKQF